MSVPFDVLDDVLNTIRLNGTVYFQKQFAGDWGIETAATPYKKFHILVDGECWLQADFLDVPLRLHSGDIVAFPHGSPYRLSAELDSPCVLSDKLLKARDAGDEWFSKGSINATLVFGHIEFTRDFRHPFMGNLPPLIHLPAHDGGGMDWLRSVANLIVSETSSPRPGSGSVVKRLAEVLHLYTLRAHVLRQQGVGSFPAVYDESPIYQSLQLIHHQLNEAWTLEGLAARVHLSRTVFATRFRDVVGMPPMQYITLWRMQKARELLETTDDPLTAVATAIGYGSEAAFSHAFQREFGEPPGRFRQRFHAR